MYVLHDGRVECRVLDPQDVSSAGLAAVAIGQLFTKLSISHGVRGTDKHRGSAGRCGGPSAQQRVIGTSGEQGGVAHVRYESTSLRISVRSREALQVYGNGGGAYDRCHRNSFVADRRP